MRTVQEELEYLHGTVQALTQLALKQNEYLIDMGLYLQAVEARYRREHPQPEIKGGPQA